MDEELFEKCTEKLLEMGESFEYILEHIETVDDSRLRKVKESVEFIQRSIERCL